MIKYIFLDESGELGFDKNSSKFFVITLLSCNEDALIRIRRIIKKVRMKKLKKKIKSIPELKGHNSSDFIREYVLKKAYEENIEIFSIILDKSKVYDYLKTKKSILYNYTANLIINECSLNDSNIKLVVDRSYGKFLAGEFNRYVKNSILQKNNNCKLEIIHEDSKKESALQVLDFICWSIKRKYELSDERFYNIIKNKIVIEKIMFGP